MNLVLIGYRGCGKSVVGELLAKQLNMVCVSMDARIVGHAGLSIPDIVERFGWQKFRDMETTVARSLSEKDRLIIDTGGGVIERPENIEALKNNGMIFWLKASTEIIVRRIEGDTQRPALVEGKTFTEEVAQVLAERTTKYRAASHHGIDTDALTPDLIAADIIRIWQTGR